MGHFNGWVVVGRRVTWIRRIAAFSRDAFKVVRYRAFYVLSEGSSKCQGQATMFKMWAERVNYCAAPTFVRRCIRCQEE